MMDLVLFAPTPEQSNEDFWYVNFCDFQGTLWGLAHYNSQIPTTDIGSGQSIVIDINAPSYKSTGTSPLGQSERESGSCTQTFSINYPVAQKVVTAKMTMISTPADG